RGGVRSRALYPRSDDAGERAARGRPWALSHAPAHGSRGALHRRRQRRAPHAQAAVREQDLGVVLTAFADRTGSAASVWTQADPSRPLILLAAAPSAPDAPSLDQLPVGADPVALSANQLVARVPSAKRAWLVVGPTKSADLPLKQLLRFLAPVVSQI